MKLFSRAAGAVAAAPPPIRAFLLGSVFFGAGIAVFEVLLNLYFQDCGLKKSEIGDVLSQRAIGTVFGALAAGTGFVRRRTALVFVVSSLMLAAGLAGQVLAPTPLLRLAASTLHGFAMTFRMVCAAPFLFRHGKDEWLATLLGLDAAIIAGTQVLGSGIAGILYSLYSFTLGSGARAFEFTLLSGTALVVASSFIYMKAGHAAPTHSEPAAPRADDAPKLSKWLLVRLCIPFFLVGAGAGLTIPYLNLYFEDRFDAHASTISIYYAAVAAMTTLGFLGSPWLAGRLGLVKSVVFSELASIPFFIILAWSTSLPLSVGAFLMRGLLMNLPYPLYGNLIMRVVGPAHRERANAMTRLAWNGSWVVTSRVAGVLLEGRGGDYVPVMLTTAALYFLASSSFWIFFRKTGY